jgi:hypothetical protein
MERWNIGSLKLEREKEETIRSTKTFTRNVQGTYHESSFAMHDTNAILRIFSVISSSALPAAVAGCGSVLGRPTEK